MNDTFSDSDKLRMVMQEFTNKLNAEPDPREFDDTPDGRAKTLPISFVEMTLDEIFLGQWETTEPKYQQIFNEVVATVELTVWHPITQRKLTRSGWASVVITQDKDAQIADFNITKKKNALDLAFPKVGAEALKNAAKSLGKIFGRDINRRKVDVFKPSLKYLGNDGFTALVARVENGESHLITLAENNFLLTETQKEILNGASSQKQIN